MLAASFIVALVSSSSSSTSPVKSPLPRAGDPFPRIGDHRYRAVLDSRMITSDSTEQSTLPFAHSTIIPSSPMSSSSSTQPHLMLTDLLTTVEDTAHCGRVIIESHLHSLLNISLHRYQPQLLLLARIISNSRDPRTFELPANSSITIKPSFLRKNNFTSPKPIFALKLICDDALPPSWTPLLIYPLKYSPNSFLLITTSPLTLDACSMSECSSKCTWSIHGGVQVHARACCSNTTEFCRTPVGGARKVLVLLNTVCAMLCIFLIPLVFRERRRHHEVRGWALIELLLLGAAVLYSILLLDWLNSSLPTCCLAVWLRQMGFSTFYGSIVLKIYRNLQEYRVRKAHHVFVKEEDLLKYLACMLCLTTTGLIAWTLGSWSDEQLWRGVWPQCSTQSWSLTWHGYELLFLMYGMRLCYKARNSNWQERWQFTAAVCLEAVVTLIVNLIRYSIQHSGHSETLLLLTFIQLQLTVSINIAIIITPKFYLADSENSRRIQTLSTSSSRAHPSLAKLRDNLLNGTIEFAEIPIVDMNPEDIRAELKRVYTQLRMYKLKNIYQENPHISKRKGGKKSSDKSAKNRRISIPTVKKIDEEERSDLTVESAPQNVFLSTYKLQLEPHQSVRV